MKSQWVLKSLEEKKWLSEDKYEAVDWFPGCKKSRTLRSTPEKLLFHDKRVHVGPSQVGISKEVLEGFVVKNGGKVQSLWNTLTLKLHSQPVGSHYAIAGKRPPILKKEESEDEDAEPVAVVTPEWLLDALTKYELPNPSKYKVEMTEREKKAPAPKKKRAPKKAAEKTSEEKAEPKKATKGQTPKKSAAQEKKEREKKEKEAKEAKEAKEKEKEKEPESEEEEEKEGSEQEEKEEEDKVESEEFVPKKPLGPEVSQELDDGDDEGNVSDEF